MAETQYSLFQLNTVIRESLKEAFRESVWVAAEVNEMSEPSAGHCYLELIEKDKKSDQIIARARGTIWQNTWRMLRPYFETSTGQEFQTGMHILVQAHIEFHELYGYSLNIKDIDPVYTLGDLERKKLETIRRLEEEGIFDMNKQLEEELVPQRIAIISSPTAAGLQDFLHQISSNLYGYQFQTKLFPAIMQGKQAEGSIVKSLDQINALAHLFDAVVIIRGGGAQADLNCFNSYSVASHVAQFPIPVITGIGHERDFTITDMVAHTRTKTPTAAAEFLISRLSEFETMLIEREATFSEMASSLLLSLSGQLLSFFNSLYPVAREKLSQEQISLIKYQSSCTTGIKHLCFKKASSLKNNSEVLSRESIQSIKKLREDLKLRTGNLEMNLRELMLAQHHAMEMKSATIRMNDPETILKKGYALVYLNGKIIKTPNALKQHDEMITRFRDGEVLSVVKETAAKEK
jgi:exodeoxyribonuclease VII large subunit